MPPRLPRTPCASGRTAAKVNGQARQSSDIDQLIWSVAECIACLSGYEALEPGDLIMTGTPEGVNAVLPGDLMRGEIQGLGAIEVRVAGRGHRGPDDTGD